MLDHLTARAGRRKSKAGTAVLLALLSVAGCGMEPYEPRNAREEGPERGLLTGSDGEFVIFRHGQAPNGQAPQSEAQPRKRGSL